MPLIFWAAACSTSIGASDYDRSCESDTDCVLVTDGDLCTPTCCFNSAISAAEQTRFQSDANAIICPARDFQPQCLCGINQIAVCTQNQCSIDVVP